MKAWNLMAAGVALTGCAAAGAAPKGLDAYPEFGRTPGKVCKAAPAKRVIGRTATPGPIEKARKLAGAATVRSIRPGQIVTTDYRTDRLNVTVNKANRITGVRCA